MWCKYRLLLVPTEGCSARDRACEVGPAKVRGNVRPESTGVRCTSRRSRDDIRRNDFENSRWIVMIRDTRTEDYIHEERATGHRRGTIDIETQAVLGYNRRRHKRMQPSNRASWTWRCRRTDAPSGGGLVPLRTLVQCGIFYPRLYVRASLLIVQYVFNNGTR